MKNQGIDTEDILARMDDLIIKTIISAESVMNKGIEMFLPTKYGN